jgi:saccharopine dehydrogenase-like NADP-dependent oxidoreductase
MSQRVAVLGSGKIGELVATLLVDSGDYHVVLADTDETRLRSLPLPWATKRIEAVGLDARDRAATIRLVHERRLEAIVSCLPYYLNVEVATAARETGVHYFDLTEDVEVTRAVRRLAAETGEKGPAFVPQCGLAPGFISVVAHHLMRRFESLDEVKLRVGALPQYPSNELKYALTWSSDGVINEYGNLCEGIVDGRPQALQPLEGLESIELRGRRYEAFNTSGGLGSLADTYRGRVRHLTYKTIRYPGHCALVRFLMNDLRLNDDRPTLKRILENAVPRTEQDVVLIYVSARGVRRGGLYEDAYVQAVYPDEIAGRRWAAIQITTAAGVATVLDLVLEHPDRFHGFVRQEDFALETFLANRFGRRYRPDPRAWTFETTAVENTAPV